MELGLGLLVGIRKCSFDVDADLRAKLEVLSSKNGVCDCFD